MAASSIPISKTKIVAPRRRPELLSRPRLLESVKGLLHNKLLLLSAPAGYGKTSLLIDLAHNVDMKVCWLSIDALDRNPQRFMAYLIAALAERFPRVGKTSRNNLRQLNSLEKDAESLLVTLTNELYEGVEEDYLLIIDDYHYLDEVPAISALLNRFLQLVDENCHVLISSRTLPDLEDVTLMVAREQVAGLSHTELAFRPREVQALYAQNHHQHLSDEAAYEFVKQTSGWITGMVFSNLPDSPHVSGIDTFAYLGQQVLDQQPPHIREFLMETCLPEEFNAELCEQILGPLHASSGPQNWLALMGWILEKNLFVLPLGDDGRWLRYHPLFREFLQSRLKRECPDKVQPILEGMVKAYEKSGEWEKAYFTCKQLDDFEALADVVEHSGTSMLQSALATLDGWINSLPPALLQSRPGLISLRGPILAMKGSLQESKELLNKAVAMYRKAHDTSGLTIALIRRANTLRFLGDYKSSLADIQEALKLAESEAALQFFYAEALRLKGLNLFRLGESRQAVEALEHSLSLFTAMNETIRLPLLLMETGMIHGAVGDVESARRSYQKALNLKQAEDDPYTQAEILNNLGVLYHQVGEYELACETFETGLACARKSHNQRAETLILTGLGDLYCEVELYDAALHAYKLAERVAAKLPGFFISNYLIIAKIDLALSQRKLTEVNQSLKASRKKMKTNPSAYERGLWALTEGRYLLFNHEPRKAISFLQQSKDLFLEDGRDLELQRGTVWLTAAYNCAHEYEAARNEISQLLTDSSSPDHALLITFQQAEAWLKDLRTDPGIARKLNSGMDKAHSLHEKLPIIRRTLRRHASTIRVPSATLFIRTLGNPEVRVNGQTVPMSVWRTQSVRDLFFYFLSQPGSVTKEQVGAALWPETRDAVALKARFKNEIFRLRHAVGRDAIIFEEEYYRFNHALDFEYDVEAFDSHMTRARKASDVNTRLDHLRKAVDLIQGSYLADVMDDWVVPERERINQLHASALEELAALYLNANQLEQCLATCQKALQLNRFHETIYQIQMKAYSALGDRSALIRCYQACRAAFVDLGIPLSEETERIYRELTA